MTDEFADFNADSAVTGDGNVWRGSVTDAWSAPPGPNGGYITALLLGAIEGEVGDPERQPRSISVHFMRPPSVGEVEIEVTIERSGRTASTATARMRQNGKTTCLALCTLAGIYESAIDYEVPMPEVPAPQEVEPLESSLPPAIFRQLEFRMVFGDPPFTESEESLVGGWTRTRVPVPLTPGVLALYADAWWPCPFPRTGGPIMAPTLDLTIHFRAARPTDPGQQVLGRFDSSTSVQGYFEENGELWSEDGTLLAQSRQLALARPLSDGWEGGG